VQLHLFKKRKICHVVKNKAEYKISGTIPKGELVANRILKLARFGFVFSKNRIQERRESFEHVPVIAIARIVLEKIKKKVFIS
jgi:hypothetical protein